MARFQKQPPVNGHEAPPAGDGHRQATRRRVEIAAVLMIPALVVGIPFLTNYSRGKPTSVTASGRPASDPGVESLAAADPLASTIGADGEVVELAVDGLPAKRDSSFWDLYQIASGGGGELIPIAPATPGSSTTSTTAGTTQPSGLSTPTSTSPPTPPSTIRKASVPRAPTNLVSDFGSPSLHPRWEAASTNSDGTAFVDFLAYEISFSAGGLTKTYGTTSTSFTYTFGQNQGDFGVAQPELTITVRAVATSGARSGPLTGVATNDVPPTPTAPANLASDSAHITVTLPSQASVDDLAGFEIYHSESATGPFVLLASTDGYDAFVHAVFTGTTHHYLYKIRDVFGQVSPGDSPRATATAT
jgi:hypothetical protein